MVVKSPQEKYLTLINNELEQANIDKVYDVVECRSVLLLYHQSGLKLPDAHILLLSAATDY